jgi:hypothetical protein
MLHLLSVELLGRSIPLAEFPQLRSIRGLGLSDHEFYAGTLRDKFSYINTFLDREPRLDCTKHNRESYGAYDFILAADVLEHIAPPLDRALNEITSLLKPNGFLCVTVFCGLDADAREHFPGLFEYKVVQLGSKFVLVNMTAEGRSEVYDNITLHAGVGETVEMRTLGKGSLLAALRDAGFSEVEFLSQCIPEFGVEFDGETSQPLIARKAPFTLSRPGLSELTAAFAQTSNALWSAQSNLRRVERELEEARSAAAESAATLTTIRESLADMTRLLGDSTRENGWLSAELSSANKQLERALRQISDAKRSRWLRMGNLLGRGPSL